MLNYEQQLWTPNWKLTYLNARNATSNAWNEALNTKLRKEGGFEWQTKNNGFERQIENRQL